jgi:hypothetical protein
MDAFTRECRDVSDALRLPVSSISKWVVDLSTTRTTAKTAQELENLNVKTDVLGKMDRMIT